VDENEDGARAILIEEGLTTWIFEKAKAHQFFANTNQLGLDLLKAVKAFVVGYEPQHLPMWLWERAILKRYAVFRELKQDKGSVLICLLGFDRTFRSWVHQEGLANLALRVLQQTRP
jgi:hypothetical protein